MTLDQVLKMLGADALGDLIGPAVVLKDAIDKKQETDEAIAKQKEKGDKEVQEALDNLVHATQDNGPGLLHGHISHDDFQDNCHKKKRKKKVMRKKPSQSIPFSPQFSVPMNGPTTQSPWTVDVWLGPNLQVVTIGP